MMKKKVLAVAVTAAAVSAGASAAIDIGTPNAVAPFIASGGTVVFESQVVAADTAGDLQSGDEIFVVLPTGASFVGTPTATSTIGTLLLDSDGAGTPGSKGNVQLLDSNNDGLMERAVVKVAVGNDAAADDDQVVFNGTIAWTGNATTTTTLSPTIFVNREGATVKADTDNVLARTLASLSKPLAQARQGNNAVRLANADSAGAAVTITGNSQLLLTIPAGTEEGKTITLTLGSGLAFDASTKVTPTALTDSAFANLTVTPPTDGAKTLTITVDGNGATAGSATTKEEQWLIEISSVETTKIGTPGAVNATLGGTAGLSGSAPVATLASVGSSAALPTGTTAATTKLVAGAAEDVALPNIEITENFAGNIGLGLLTLEGGDGLSFVTGGGETAAWATGGAIAAGVVDEDENTVTFDITGLGTGPITISGLNAVADKGATGTLNVRVGDSSVSGQASNVPNAILGVATAVARGAVEVAGPETLDSVGAGSSSVGVITLTEETYGAITRENATTTTSSYIQIIPPAGVTIEDIGGTAGVVRTDETAGGSLDLSDGTAATPADGSYIIGVNAESNTKGVVEIEVEYSVDADVATGTDVVFTLAGNANVSGEATVATVSSTTKNTVGTIPSVVVGSPNPQQLASLTITENFATALTNSATGEFRLIAPAGVTFTGSTLGTTTTTFSANDTILVPFVPTGAVDSVTFTPTAVIGGSIAKDALLSFQLADAVDTADRIGLVTGSVDLAYTGVLEALDAGANASVNVGFSATSTISGGRAPYTVSSGSPAVASASVDGDVVSVLGLSAGTSVITVTDSLNNSDTFLVTVAAGAAQNTLGTVQRLDGTDSTAVLSAGASIDGGATFDDEFTTEDDVTIVGTIQPEAEDVGVAGELFAVVRANINGNIVWGMLNEDNQFVAWDLEAASLQPARAVDALAATERLEIWNGNLWAGTYMVFLGYMAEDGQIIYNREAMEFTVTGE